MCIPPSLLEPLLQRDKLIESRLRSEKRDLLVDRIQIAVYPLVLGVDETKLIYIHSIGRSLFRNRMMEPEVMPKTAIKNNGAHVKFQSIHLRRHVYKDISIGKATDVEVIRLSLNIPASTPIKSALVHLMDPKPDDDWSILEVVLHVQTRLARVLLYLDIFGKNI